MNEAVCGGRDADPKMQQWSTRQKPPTMTTTDLPWRSCVIKSLEIWPPALHMSGTLTSEARGSSNTGGNSRNSSTSLSSNLPTRPRA